MARATAETLMELCAKMNPLAVESSKEDESKEDDRFLTTQTLSSIHSFVSRKCGPPLLAPLTHSSLTRTHRGSL